MRAPVSRQPDLSEERSRMALYQAGAAAVGTREILMSSVPSSEKLSVYHINGLFSGQIPLRKSMIKEWPHSCAQLQCLHCGGCCTHGPPVPATRFYDSQVDQYWLYGPFCRPCCSLGYICEYDNTSKQLAPTIELLRRYFGISDIKVAPPRASHQRFGGPLNDADFYGTSGFVSLNTLQPPFVTFANYVVGVHQSGQGQNQSQTQTEMDIQDLLPQSAGKLVHLDRPEFRKDPIAKRLETGKGPLILDFLANLKNLEEINDASEQITEKHVPKKRKLPEVTEAPNFLRQYVKKSQ